MYRARDTKLRRDVAIKTLPLSVSGDPERLRRFEREAHLLASLNHPHIAAIYGFEEGSGIVALVLELVDGPTLADRLAGGPIALDEALSIARQMADALEEAHEHGVVHRDLKPANVKLTPDGTVKVLDFGLAKAEPAMAELADSPTITAVATCDGVIMGTAPYMSPEQARGKAVDKRTDIWAFGCVLYELLTGIRAFPGETTTDVLAAIVHREPDWLVMPATTPASIRQLLDRCLRKDPRQRLRDIGEARIAIDAAVAGETLPPVELAEPRIWWQRMLPWTVAATAFVVALVVWSEARRNTSQPSEGRWQKFTQLTDLAGEEGAPAISPDGMSFAYTSRARGSWDIYVQRIGGHNPILVAGDPDRQESAPTFSPDGQRLAFHQEDGDGGIFIVGATGESPRRLTDRGFHPAWSPDGRSIVYCSESVTERAPSGRMGVSTLWVVDLGSGATRKIDDGDAVQPVWPPSGARIAFWAMSGGQHQRDLFTIPASGGAHVAVLQDPPLDWSPAWSPDGRFLYFASDRGGARNIWRIAIDESTGRAHGAPEPITTSVQAAADLPSLSKDGRKLVFRSRLTTVNPVAVPFDARQERLGPPTALVERTGILNPSAVSRDGQWLALGNFGEQREDIFSMRTDGRDLRRLTDDVARDRKPTWSPDGRELAFYSNRGGNFQIWTVRSDGSRLMQRSDLKSGDLMYPLWSPTGDRMVASKPSVPDTIGYLWDVTIGWSSAKMLPGLMTAEGWLRPLDWSPDGRRLAGVVQDVGANAVAVAWYDINTDTTGIVSHDRLPTPSDVRWLPDSRRIVFVNDKGELVLVDADTKRRNVLQTPWSFKIGDESVAVAPDGRTIYLLGRARSSQISGWQSSNTVELSFLQLHPAENSAEFLEGAPSIKFSQAMDSSMKRSGMRIGSWRCRTRETSGTSERGSASRTSNVNSATTAVRPADGTFDTITAPAHPKSVPSLLRRLASVVCVLALAQGAVAQCAGWQATPEARRQCCRDGACPLHHSEDGASRTKLSQAAADDCCAQSQRHESSPSGTVFASTMALAVVNSLPPLVLNLTPTAPLSAPWETPSPPAHVRTHLLLSVFLV